MLRRGHDPTARFGLQSVQGETRGRARNRKCAHELSGGVKDRSGRAAHARFALLDVEGETLTRHALKFFCELFGLHDSFFGPRAEAGTRGHGGHKIFTHRFARARHQDLAQGRTIHRQPIAHPQPGQQHSIGLNTVEMDNLLVAQDAKMRGFAGLERQLIENRMGAPQQRMPSNEALAQFKAPRTQTVPLGLGALLDITMLLKGREEPKDVVLVQPETPGKLAHP